MCRINKKGQQVIEYILLFIVVVLVIIAAFGPEGFVTKQVDRSINSSFKGIEYMAQNVYYNIYNEPWNNF